VLELRATDEISRTTTERLQRQVHQFIENDQHTQHSEAMQREVGREGEKSQKQNNIVFSDVVPKTAMHMQHDATYTTKWRRVAEAFVNREGRLKRGLHEIPESSSGPF